MDGSGTKNYFDIDDPKGISKESSWEWKTGTKGTVYKISILKDTDIDYIMFLIKQKYKNIINPWYCTSGGISCTSNEYKTILIYYIKYW